MLLQQESSISQRLKVSVCLPLLQSCGALHAARMTLNKTSGIELAHQHCEKTAAVAILSSNTA